MRSRSSNLSRVCLVLAAVAFIAPLWFLGTGSTLKASKFIMMPPRLLPRSPVLDNYLWVVTRPGLVGWLANTGMVVALTAVGSTIVSTMAGYAFSVYRFRFKRILWAMLLSGLMVPRIALVIPLFVVANRLGLTGTIAAVVLPCLLAPTWLFLARKYFDTVPRSLIESARMDGATERQVLAHVVVPVSRPIVTACALFSAVGALQDWIWQALQLQDPARQTLLVGLIRATMQRSTTDNDANPIGHAMAAGVVLLIPLLLIFLAANRYFTEGVGGAVKE